jgi:hypothetical protein
LELILRRRAGNLGRREKILKPEPEENCGVANAGIRQMKNKHAQNCA